ncbi:hypothetical protein [Bradyrhizobium liaoningense]
MAAGVMLEYSVEARRIDVHGSVATTKQAEITLDTNVKGRPDAFNPAETACHHPSTAQKSWHG